LLKHPSGSLGFQVLCDHRPGGGIGRIFTYGLGSYLATRFVVDGVQDENFRVKNFRQGKSDPRLKQGTVSDPASFEAFRDVWNLNDWNRFRVRCVGNEPTITIWINALKTGSSDTSDPGLANYDASQIRQLVGSEGRIGLEVHSNDFGNDRTPWSQGAVSRWRNIRLRQRIV
jgi:hypothetical protein